MLNIRLNRNLRKVVSQGHPWIFRDAIVSPSDSEESQLCKVLTHKGEFLAWALYNAETALSLRILSQDKKLPGEREIQQRFMQAKTLRQNIISKDTNAYRLFNGEGDLLPGLICDVYADVAVLQFDGHSAKKFWCEFSIPDWLLKHAHCTTVVMKPRANEGAEFEIFGEKRESLIIEISEYGKKFLVNIKDGQKTGFFLDQRENRKYVGEVVNGLSGLNIFSYTGGFSVYAGAGGAKKVASLDFGQAAVELAQTNWELNKLDANNHKSIYADAFKYLDESKEKWDFVIVDPPSLTRGEKHKDLAMKKYSEIFTSAAKRVKSGGHFFVSSCSSHINFSDFKIIVDQSLSGARRKGQVLRVSGQGPDHPFPHICEEFRYLKFMHLILS